MNNEVFACYKQKNKHLSQTIGKKYKKAQRIHRRKSKNYRKQKHRRNSFIRQDGKKAIKHAELDYISEGNIMSEDYITNEAKCQVKLVFVCDQDKQWKKQYTIKRKSLKLQMSKDNSNINVEFDNDYSSQKNQQGEEWDNKMVHLLYYDYYYDSRRMLEDRSTWKDYFDVYGKDYDEFGRFGLPAMNDFAQDLVGYLLSMYLRKGKNYYARLKKKKRLFDCDYNLCSYDINDINDEIVNWFDKLNIELNNNNCLSNNLYSLIILQYLFEPINHN